MEIPAKTPAMILIVVALMAASLDQTESVLHKVGDGKYTWMPNVNYTEWANKQHFYAGDWIYFGFDKKLYNVLEVNKTSYENCVDTGFITNITRGGRDVFQLKEAKRYYFISGRGFCSKGMKVEVDVHPPLSPSPAPSPSGSSGLAASVSISTALVVSALLSALVTMSL